MGPTDGEGELGERGGGGGEPAVLGEVMVLWGRTRCKITRAEEEDRVNIG